MVQNNNVCFILTIKHIDQYLHRTNILASDAFGLVDEAVSGGKPPAGGGGWLVIWKSDSRNTIANFPLGCFFYPPWFLTCVENLVPISVKHC